MKDKKNYVFGPVPSRRLGRSLGVDLVPKKTCSMSCIYCQIGRTAQKTLKRDSYVPVEEVLAQILEKLKAGAAPDTITLSGSGEPTLNRDIGHVIRAVKDMTETPVAVLTNASLMSDPQVRQDLLAADIVAPSLDAGTPQLFELINRPHPDLDFDAMIEGLAAFAKEFTGKLLIEVFLLGGMNALASEVKKIAAITKRMPGAVVQLNTVTRPPAEDFAMRVPREKMEYLAGLFDPPAEVIADFRKTEEAGPHRSARTEDVLEMLSRRPCTLDDVAAGLGIEKQDAKTNIEALLADERIKVSERNGLAYYSIPDRVD